MTGFEERGRLNRQPQHMPQRFLAAYQFIFEARAFSTLPSAAARCFQAAPYVSFATVDAAQIQWKSGRDALKVYASSPKNGRYFCPDCGAHVMVISQDEPDTVYLTAGCMEGNPPLPAGYHEFVDSKAPWVGIPDDEPQHSGPAGD